MKVSIEKRVRFGELAGPLVHGSRLFDWFLILTQETAIALGYPFEAILAEDGIPYAPVDITASISRYPVLGEAVTLQAAPRKVGDSSIELIYDVIDHDGELLATAMITHVTISPDGGALPLPDRVRREVSSGCVDRDPSVGPASREVSGDDLPSFSSTSLIRSPHIEGAKLAYFEEYPRFCDIALEEYLAKEGESLAELQNGKQPYRLHDWHWRFLSPVEFESTLDVTCSIRSVTRDAIQIEHVLSSNGETKIDGVTEYGCFDGSGDPVPFDESILRPFR